MDNIDILNTKDSTIYVRLVNAGRFLLFGRLFFTVGGTLKKLCTGPIDYGYGKTLNLPSDAKELAFRIDAYRCGYSSMVYNGAVPEGESTCLLVYGQICDPIFVRVYCPEDENKLIPSVDTIN